VSGSFTVSGGRPLRGRLRVPGDKSISHRALLLGALAEGTSTVRGLSDGDDVVRTRRAVEAMGAKVEGDTITGGALHQPAGVLDVGNSGTGMRLLLGLCAGLPWTTTLDGDGSVRGRPMDRVNAPLRRMGARIDADLAPVTVAGGGLTGIDYEVPVPSAQVKSAVLLAGLHAEGETVVRETARTRAHTEEMLEMAGADIAVDGEGAIRLHPSQLRPFHLDVPGDPSQAAFWIVAACIVPGSDLTVENVYLGPARAGFLDVLQRMGADVTVHGTDIRARHSHLRATDVGGEEVPSLIDEIPVLAVAAAAAEGVTTFRDAAELRIKETDRVATTVALVAAAGAVAEARPDGLRVVGTAGHLRRGEVDSSGDHRIAMAMAVAALAADGVSTIHGWDAVATSYPGFAEDLARCAS
jgi:3-phosphoshikimate 1-carboxyvinyltransferase